MATAFDSLFQLESQRTGVPVAVLEGLARTESSLRADVQRWEPKVEEYSWGLMGLLESTARAYGFTGAASALKDPATNIRVGANYAADIIRRQGGLVLPNFYSEWNSGNATLWQRSQQVAEHVANFLRNVEKSGGVQAAAPLLPVVALAAVVWWIARR